MLADFFGSAGFADSLIFSVGAVLAVTVLVFAVFGWGGGAFIFGTGDDF
jgi:hypothetical protein